MCYVHDVVMKRRRPNWFGIKYQPPSDDIKKLMKDHWGVPFWGVPESGPTGLLFLLQSDVVTLLSGSAPTELSHLKLVTFNLHATKSEKRDWLDELGLSAVREDCSRTRVSWTREWVPLLRQGSKPFGLTGNRGLDLLSEDFYVFENDASAHFFGDGFTLAQRREYAKKLGADIGLVEPLKGKGPKKGVF
jgi:hypothetical protein